MKILSFLISCLIAMSLMSCGVEVDKQPTPSLQPPSAESTAAGDGFSLSSVEDATFSFSGSGLFLSLIHI